MQFVEQCPALCHVVPGHSTHIPSNRTLKLLPGTHCKPSVNPMSILVVYIKYPGTPVSVASSRVQCVVGTLKAMEKVDAMRRTTKQGPKARPRNRSGWWRKQRRTQHLQGDLHHDIKARRDDWLQVQAAFFRPLRRPTENHAPGHQMQNHPKPKLKLKS